MPQIAEDGPRVKVAVSAGSVSTRVTVALTKLTVHPLDESSNPLTLRNPVYVRQMSPTVRRAVPLLVTGSQPVVTAAAPASVAVAPAPAAIHAQINVRKNLFAMTILQCLTG